MARTLTKAERTGLGMHDAGKPLSLEELEKSPHLRQLAEAVRKVLHANKTLGDINLENKLIYENFIRRCENDLMFYLEATNQHHLISIIFADPGIIAKIIRAILHARSHHEKRNEHLQEQYVAPATSKKSTDYATAEPDFTSRFDWIFPDPGLSNAGQWLHYEKELQRITADYRAQRTQIHHDAIASDANHFDNILSELRRDPVRNREEIVRLNAMKNEINEEQQEIMSYPIHHADGTVNESAVIYREERMEQLKAKSGSFLDGYLVHHGSPEMREIQAQREQKNSLYKAELRQLDIQFSEKREELMKHRDAACIATKTEFHENLQAAIRSLESFEANPAQREALTESIAQLKKYEQRLNGIRDFNEMQEVVQECNAELKKTEQIVNSSPPMSDTRKFSEAVTAIAKTLVTFLPEEQAAAQSYNNREPPPAYEEIPVTLTVPDAVSLSERQEVVGRDRQVEMRAEIQARREYGMFRGEGNQVERRNRIEALSKAWEAAQNLAGFEAGDMERASRVTNLLIRLKESDNTNSLEVVKALSININGLKDKYEILNDVQKELDSISDLDEDLPLQNSLQLR